MLRQQGWLAPAIILSALLIFAGCNSGTSPQGETAENGGRNANPDELGPDLPTVSIDPQMDEEEEEDLDDVAVKEPEPGTPEWQIREILKIRLKPFAPAKKPGQEEGDSATASTESPAENPEEFAKIRRERNLQVIDLAKQVISQTHKNSEKEMVFNAAVHHLLDARLQLALGGEQEDVDALYEICDALQQSKPHSEVASAAALTIVNFSHANAVRYAQSEPKWIQEFAKQAQIFARRVADSQAALSEEEAQGPRATQIKSDASRAAQILMAAGQSCDAAGFPDDGKNCYLLIKSRFADTPQAQQVAGIVRRLNLKGQPLQLAGPTLDGNFLSIEDFKGKTVLVVFWSSQAKPFVDHLPALTDLLKRAQKHVSVIGVCLDTDEAQLDAFLEEQGIHWPQIYYSEPDKRGWNSPLANYYGITSLPTLWIVDPEGVVAETTITSADVEPKLKEVVRQSLKTTKSGGNSVVPAGNTEK